MIKLFTDGGWKDARISWLDFKLGFRMLSKYPGLTLVGGLAIAFAIWVGAGTFEFVTQVVHPTLPLEEGDRVVGIRQRDAAAGRAVRPGLHDFVAWKGSLESVEHLGAFRTADYNLIAGDRVGEPVEVAEISASAFDVARVAPLLGRALLEEDERAGAPPVVVLGHELWQKRFGADRQVVGREVTLGTRTHTVVGVMPEGFAFPVAHRVWTPLRLDPTEYERGEAPRLRVFGRLAPGVTMEEAQAELTAVGQRAAADFPDTNGRLRPQVLPYAHSILNLSTLTSAGLLSSNLVLVLLLVLVCGNVALLMFARAASRETELVVRTALGASRARIMGQLFAEALVLTGVGAAVGLAAMSLGLEWGLATAESQFGRLPFWIHGGLSPRTVLYAVLLTVAGALIAGVVPALKATRGLASRLRQTTAGGGGFRFGGLWTAIIVAQVAVTLVFPALTFFVRLDAKQIRSVDVGFPAEEYLSARLELNRGDASPATADRSRDGTGERKSAIITELERRLEAEPGVAGVTFAERLPRMYHPHRRIELDDGPAAPIDPQFGYRRVSSTRVALDYFDVLDAPILAGRGFHPADLATDAGVVVVNESFVDIVLGGHNPIGRRLRYTHFEEWEDPRPTYESPWYEIVGVVRDMGMDVPPDPNVAGFYHPAPVDRADPLHMAVHVRGDASAFTPRLRTLAARVDPALRLHEVMPLDQVIDEGLRLLSFWFWLTTVVSAVALLLALAGIYAVMAFTVAQRTREIGIRVALGADRGRVLRAIFRRPLGQVGLGILAGSAALAGLLFLASGTLTLLQVGALAAYAALVTGVCLLACVVPTRRALRVEPTEALKAEG